MTIQFALEYIPRKMRELGYGNNYTLRLRNIVVPANEKVLIDSYGGEFFILVEENLSVKVLSDTGVYDRSDPFTNELQYEHQGEIQIQEIGSSLQVVRFIQVIPLHEKVI